MARNLFVLNPEASKRLIGRGVVQYEPFRRALKNGTVVIVAGSTNGWIAEALLGKDFPRRDFLRGYLGPSFEKGPFPGDVVLRRGVWDRGRQIFDVVGELGPEDLILKGANAVNPALGQAAVLVADPRGGTVLRALEALFGRRTRILVPVGLEKSVTEDLFQLSRYVNLSSEPGWRLVPLAADIFTELEAFKVLWGLEARHVAAGGIAGGEGSVVLLVEGPREQLEEARRTVEECGGYAGA